MPLFSRTNRRRPTGAAAAEFAVCLPVMILLLFGAMEACTMIYLKQSLTIAAYEAGRTATLPGATSGDVVADCERILAERNVSGGQITLNPLDIAAAPVGSQLLIAVSAPCDLNRISGAWFFGGRTLAGRAEFMKEY